MTTTLCLTDIDQLRREYLIVDDYLHTILDAQTLKTAIDFGWIDQLAMRPDQTLEDLACTQKLDQRGTAFVLDILRRSGVVRKTGDLYALHPRFRKAWHYHDLIVAKLEFASLIAPEVLHSLPRLLTNPKSFFEQSQILGLFDYEKCFEFTSANEASTKRWMHYTTLLTRYEAANIASRFDFESVQDWLDIGGNSGEFALRICRLFPHLQATVADLPLVCKIGEQHLALEPESSRIRFQPADVLDDVYSPTFDLVSFKSMLHDWPEHLAKLFLQKAHEALRPGGTLLIFERGMIDFSRRAMPFSLIPILLFFRSYRLSTAYVPWLNHLGFHEIEIQEFDLDTPFFLITARKS